MFAPEGFFSLYDFSMGMLSNYSAALKDLRRSDRKPITLELSNDDGTIEMSIPAKSMSDVYEEFYVATWSFFDGENRVQFFLRAA